MTTEVLLLASNTISLNDISYIDRSTVMLAELRLYWGGFADIAMLATGDVDLFFVSHLHQLSYAGKTL